MTNKMTEEKVNHSTYRLCTDLLNILDHHNNKKYMERFLYMPDSSLSNKGISKNFKIMLVILFLMEFARGMYVLSYVNYLPTVTSIRCSDLTALSIHFISDAATNFVIGFLFEKIWY